MSYSNRYLLSAWVELENKKAIQIERYYNFSLVIDLCGSEYSLIESKSPDGDLGHVAFAREIGVGFEILMFLVVGREWSRSGDGPITDVWPTFYMRGRTFEGLIEVRSNDDLPSNLNALSEQLLWARQKITDNGWDD